MTEHDRMGSHPDPDAGEGITLPSWVDAAIAKARSEGDETDRNSEEAVEAPAPDAPFPSFLDRRPTLHQASEPFGASEAPESSGPIPEHGSPLAFAQEPSEDEYDELDQQRAEIVTEALAEESDSSSSPRPEPIPLPVAPIRRRGPSGPWLMAALFFAAAALVLAVLMWVRPVAR